MSTTTPTMIARGGAWLVEATEPSSALPCVEPCVRSISASSSVSP